MSTGENLVAVDPATGQKGPSYPRRFALSLDGGRLWGWEAPPGGMGGMPYPIWTKELGTGKTTFPLTLNDYPLAMAFDGVRLWYISARDSLLYDVPVSR